MQIVELITAIQTEMSRHLVGQTGVVEALLVGVLTGGHILLEGVPGLAKTLAARVLAGSLGGKFSRIQFTPDLLPSDIVGSTVYQPETGQFATRPGPVAANFVLADEINRAPAKVQSALLEAMQEHQVTIAGQRFPLPEPFLVIATQNPIEQAGTYPLPEAEKDRFLLNVHLTYPEREEELQIMARQPAGPVEPQVRQVVAVSDVLAARQELEQVQMDSQIADYALDLVVATRPGQQSRLSARQDEHRFDADALVECGASPRASLAIVQAARALALLHGRAYVIPHDIKQAARLALPHRIIPSLEAENRGFSSRDLVEQLLGSLLPP
ncbi:MAG: MoxR family ATPase [Victivallales bacterium]|nr:MoxR family ATPase [Victivallales bacterium]